MKLTDYPQVFSDSPHSAMGKTLDLVKIGDTFFVFKGGSPADTIEDMREHRSYVYQEHSCVTTILCGSGCVAAFEDGDSDPHGVFEWVTSEWMPEEFVATEREGGEIEMLFKIFPQVRGAT